MGVTRKLNRHCGCGTPVSDQSKTGRCLRCNLRLMNSDPQQQAARAEAFRRRLRDDPLELARRRAQMRQNTAKGLARPEVRAALVERGHRQVPLMWTPEAIAKRKAGHAEAMRRRAERQLAWCPAHKRDRYEYLVYTRRIRSATAREIVLAELKAETEALSPFERQMRALQNGARLVANDPLPSGNQVVRRFG